MSNAKKYALAALVLIVAILCGYAIGRYMVPPKVEEKIVQVDHEVVRTEIQYVDKIVYVKAVANNVVTNTTTTKRPDGTEVVETRVIDKSKTEESSTQQVVVNEKKVEDKLTESEKSTTTTANKDYHVRVDVGAGARFVGQLTPVLQLGVGFERRIVGPFFGGLWVNTQLNLLAPSTPPYTMTAGISVGLEF